MKKIVFPVIILVVSTLGCTKQSSKTENPLIGKWQWVKSVGGIAGSVEISPEEGEFRFLEFFANYTYTFTQTGPSPVSYTAAYSLTVANDIEANQGAPAVILYDEAGQPGIPQIIKQDDNSSDLVVKENCADCYIHSYNSVR